MLQTGTQPADAAAGAGGARRALEPADEDLHAPSVPSGLQSPARAPGSRERARGWPGPAGCVPGLLWSRGALPAILAFASCKPQRWTCTAHRAACQPAAGWATLHDCARAAPCTPTLRLLSRCLPQSWQGCALDAGP